MLSTRTTCTKISTSCTVVKGKVRNAKIFLSGLRPSFASMVRIFQQRSRHKLRLRTIAQILGASQQLMSFNKPTNSEHGSAMAYVHNNRPINDKEAEYVRYKEDLITLRPGREYAWLDACIERLLRWSHCRLIEVRLVERPRIGATAN